MGRERPDLQGLPMAMAMRAAVYATLETGLAPLLASPVRWATLPEVTSVASDDTERSNPSDFLQPPLCPTVSGARSL